MVAGSQGWGLGECAPMPLVGELPPLTVCQPREDIAPYSYNLTNAFSSWSPPRFGGY